MFRRRLNVQASSATGTRAPTTPYRGPQRERPAKGSGWGASLDELSSSAKEEEEEEEGRFEEVEEHGFEKL